ncbi:MAG: hypothetical protein DDT19_00024 [Syntrophomonadaceae bacterium]|nr:hypothetical protein [Bacillota bacterium]
MTFLRMALRGEFLLIKYFRNNRFNLFVYSLIIIFLACGFLIVFPEKEAESTPCSPVITKTNTSYFGQLYGALVRDIMTAKMKEIAMQKRKDELAVSSYLSSQTNINSTLSNLQSTINNGFADHMRKVNSFVEKKVATNVFTRVLNTDTSREYKVQLDLLNEKIKKRMEMEEDAGEKLSLIDVGRAVGEFNGFIETPSVKATYNNEYRAYQKQVGSGAESSSSFCFQMTSVGALANVNDNVTHRNSNNNILIGVGNECKAQYKNLMQTITDIYTPEIRDAVKNKYNVAVSNDILKKLMELKEDGIPITNEDIAEVIGKVNDRSIITTDRHFKKIVGEFGVLTTATTNSIINSAIEAKNIAVADIMSDILRPEMQDEFIVQRTIQGDYKKTKQVLFKDKGQWEGTIETLASYSAQGKPLSDINKVAVFMASPHRELSEKDKEGMTKRRIGEIERKKAFTELNIKRLFTAYEAWLVAEKVTKKMSSFKVSAIDSAKSDRAWKDAVRFQYYWLLLLNERLKLESMNLAVSAGFINNQ